MAKKKKEVEWVLEYPVKNKVLRFYGDVMLLLGTVITRHGLRFGGIYKVEDED